MRQRSDASPVARFRLEICIDSARSALAAQAGGAARVELCANLLEGGTTPSAGTISLVRQQINLGLHVLIRPRSGDFCYSQLERETMRRDILTAKQLGADGAVFGLLLPDGSVDRAGTAALIDLARPMKVTFHRAFDLTRDPGQALEEIIALGADYLLTSGQQQSAMAGSDLLADLIRQAGDRIVIMPGGGVNAENIRQLARLTGAVEFHSSGRRPMPSRMQFRRENVFMGAWQQSEFVNSFVDEQKVRRMLSALTD